MTATGTASLTNEICQEFLPPEVSRLIAMGVGMAFAMKMSSLYDKGWSNSLSNSKVIGKIDDVKGTGGGKPPVRDTLLNEVENVKFKNAVNEIYRPGATTGDGGLADAVRHELSTGNLVGGKSHITKATERITNLKNIINKQNLNSKDLGIANKLLRDLENALKGK